MARWHWALAYHARQIAGYRLHRTRNRECWRWEPHRMPGTYEDEIRLGYGPQL
jgi:hypothetical protein